ncbi:hypothetical protein NDU88_000816 [Pleurodeles waltl]|uniref:Uncharacterized protein n=1 Tax=Pleurodeles waltl TaxID=8319 RepID=A0AAV7LBA8_PLEWA|nr:hypothetical protein NDU88_000816 [Pleurodeles waltl]
MAAHGVRVPARVETGATCPQTHRDPPAGRASPRGSSGQDALQSQTLLLLPTPAPKPEAGREPEVGECGVLRLAPVEYQQEKRNNAKDLKGGMRNELRMDEVSEAHG